MDLILLPVGLGCEYLNTIEIDINHPTVISLGRNDTTTQFNPHNEAPNIGTFNLYLTNIN